MVKVAYFDCFSGISGDMILGALIDLGLDVGYLKGELGKLDISGYEIKARRVEKNHVFGTDFEVVVKEKQRPRSLLDILNLIEDSGLDVEVKRLSKKIFQKLGEAESKVHDISIDEVHFHEVGAVDSIIDIVGAAVGIKKLGVENVFCSNLPLGTGFISCAHGKLPVPSPATVEILKGVPVYYTNVRHEMVTPTGAAIITSISSCFGEMPLMKISRIGYGVGKTDMEHPNLLRVFLGDAEGDYGFEVTNVIETNVDDMNPEVYDYLFKKLFDNGALDVFLTNIQMKKNRPGVKLSVISAPEDVGRLLDIIFDETTTFGVRIYETRRAKLYVEKKTVRTKYGDVTVKIGKLDGVVKTVSPEYEDCRKVAERNKISLKEVYELVKKKYYPEI
jgi:hypothetical protein